MVSLDTALLRGWRGLAFLGHYSGLDTLADSGTNRVLRYHSVGDGVYDDISPAYFRRQLAYLDAEYDIVDLPAVLRPGGETKRVALTFDDGYRDFYEHVWPILREYDAPATVFVIGDALENATYSHTDDEIEYMDLDEVLELVDDELVTVGNHTHSHPELPTLSRSQLRTEIVGAQEHLESLLGTEVTRFAYPYNSFDDRASEIVRETHDHGVVSRGRFEPVTPETDPATIPRINGPNPFYELCWDLSDASTRVGAVGAGLLGR